MRTNSSIRGDRT